MRASAALVADAEALAVIIDLSSCVSLPASLATWVSLDCCVHAQDLTVARLGLRSKQQAFLVILAVCLTIAFTLFGAVVLAWA